MEGFREITSELRELMRVDYEKCEVTYDSLEKNAEGFYQPPMWYCWSHVRPPLVENARKLREAAANDATTETTTTETKTDATITNTTTATTTTETTSTDTNATTVERLEGEADTKRIKMNDDDEIVVEK